MNFLPATILFAIASLGLVDSRSTAVNVYSFPLECMVRQFNFTPTVTDVNGKKCRGSISTKACFGSCESYEYGNHEFPYIVSVTPVCNYDETLEVTTKLTDCDTGVHPSARTYKYIEAVSCVCSECNPKTENCKHIPTKRNGADIPVSDGEFGNYVPTRKPKKRGSNRRTRQKQIQFWWILSD